MNSLVASELVLNQRGAVYHLDLRPEALAPTVLTVGDPGRVPEVSKYFDAIEFRRSHREFVTHTGYIGKKRLTVVSTGIGTDNIDIVLNELDALVNIDLSLRTIRPTPTSLRIIRIGTCGSLQADIPVDSFVASTYGLGIDNLLHFYRSEPGDAEKQLLQAFITQTQLHPHISQPYIAPAAASLIKYFVENFHHGITVSCPGFYGPQGRTLRLGLALPALVKHLAAFCFGSHRICNLEMETAAIYGLGKLLGHQCLSLSAVVANRVSGNFSADVAGTVDRLIRTALSRLSDEPAL